jgi:uncharacterized protein (DUF488 family)
MATGHDPAGPSAPRIFTVGHSTRAWDEFIALLAAHGVVAVADVRLIPKSRRHPQFRSDFLSAELPKRGLQYLPFPALGGRRRPAPDSVNDAWRNESFRGYADYMQTAAFAEALHELTRAAARAPTAIMCAEAVPWRCHRSLIADALLVRGWQVLDIMDAAKAPPHKLTPFARVEGTRITYPAGNLFDHGTAEAS